MQGRINSWIALFLMMVTIGCREPFEANIPGQDTGFLVVEGYINVGTSAVSTIKLSRTTAVEESVKQVNESGAVVVIEDEQLNQFPLVEKGKGIYSSAELSLPTDQKFRISIRTSNGKKYYSRFEQPVITPAIDGLSWERVDEGVSITVSTHDPSNKTHYYQWDYEEVWELRSPFLTHYYYSNGQIFFRSFEERDNMYICWKYDYPDHLLTESTAGQTVDSVVKQIILVPLSDEKISTRYAVTVKQTALSREHYEYLELMERNTDDVGTFSDPQPSELHGNIVHEGSDEPVIGFVGAYTTSEARIFIKEREVPGWNFDLNCEVLTIADHPDTLKKYLGGAYIPTLIAPQSGTVNISTPPCVDCTRRGGNNNKPDFWD